MTHDTTQNKPYDVKRELERLRSPRYCLRLGMLMGGTLILAVLGLSFVKPYWDYIITTSFWFVILVGAYITYVIGKLSKIEKILRDFPDNSSKKEVPS